MSHAGDALRRVVVPVLALVTAFLLGGVVIVLTDVEHLSQLGTDPLGALAGAIGLVVEGYGAMLAGAIGDPARIATALQSGESRDIAAAIRPITETLVGATPFIVAGLAVAVSFRAGLINLGVDGQFLVGSLGVSIAASVLHGSLPPLAILVVALAAGALSGAVYGGLAGILKARFGAHEVITTLMLNVIAGEFAFLILRAFDAGGPLRPITEVPRIIDLPTIRLDWGFVVALVMTAVVSFVLFRTTLGLELRSTGFSRTAARSSGIPPGRTIVLAMAMSGGLVGLASGLVSLGPVGRLAPPPIGEFGFVVLALALLGGLRPAGVALAALLYGALNTGAKNMVIVTGIPLALLVFIVAIAMMLVAAPSLTRSLWRLGRSRPTSEPDPARPPGPPDAMVEV